MKQIITTVYNFSELSAKAKEVARNWYRENCIDGFFAESVIEDTKAIGKLLGYDIDKVYYSGFASQGDGACFVGSWSGTLDIDKLKFTVPHETELHLIANALLKELGVFPNTRLTIEYAGGHYYHEKSVNFDVSIADDDENQIFSKEAEDCRTQLIDLTRDFMRWIYSQLKKDYEFQTSDKAVDESIEANEYTFRESGKRFGN
jgi:hypothetical protein